MQAGVGEVPVLVGVVRVAAPPPPRPAGPTVQEWGCGYCCVCGLVGGSKFRRRISRGKQI